MVDYINPHWFGTSQKGVETKGTNNLFKAESQYGVFSSLFFISGISVIVAHHTFQCGGGGAKPSHRSS